MQCPRCYFDNAADASVCEYCGAPLERAQRVSMPVNSSANKRRTQLGTTPAPSVWEPEQPPAPTPDLDPDDPFRLAARSVRAGPAPRVAPRTPEPTAPASQPLEPAHPPTPTTAPQRPRRSTLLDEGLPVPDREIAGVALMFEPECAPRAVILHQGRTRIGRAHDSDLRLEDPRASSDHAILRIEGEEAWLLDTSSNGTFFGATRVMNDKAQVRDGTVLGMGRTRVVVKLLASETLDLLRDED